MLVFGIFNFNDSYLKVRDKYQNENLEFGQNIMSLEELKQCLIIARPSIVIIDNNISFKSEAIELISSQNKQTKFVSFDGNFDILYNSLDQVISLMEIKNERDQVVTDEDSKVVFIENKYKQPVIPQKENNISKTVNIDKDSKSQESTKHDNLDYTMKIAKIEEPVIIEKEVTKVKKYRGEAVISFISASSTGKTYLSWNLAYALSITYKVGYVNIDRYFTAACYCGVKDGKEMSFSNVKEKTLKEVMEQGVKLNNNLTLYTGMFSLREHLSSDFIRKVIREIRNVNDIVIIDTETLDDNMEKVKIISSILDYTTDNLIVYDCDTAHLKLNNIMLSRIEKIQSLNNAYAVINNVNIDSRELVNVNTYLTKLKKFRNVVTVRNSDEGAYDYIFSNTCNYLKESNGFSEDIDNIINVLKLQGKENNNNNKQKGLFKFFKGR